MIFLLSYSRALSPSPLPGSEEQQAEGRTALLHVQRRSPPPAVSPQRDPGEGTGVGARVQHCQNHLLIVQCSPMRIPSAVALLLTLMALSGCGPATLTLSSRDGTKTVQVTVEIADSPSERETGLMKRKKLQIDTGMLFVFRDPQMLSFWMKNTLIPLDILFFDADGEFVSAMQMTPCIEDPCPRYKSQALSKYALEVNPDFRKAHGVGVGWTLNLDEVRKMARPS